MKVPVSTRLLRETDLAEAGWIVRLAFGTFLGIPDPEKAFHLHLYQKFGFWPRFLTALMSLPAREAASDSHCTRYSEATPEQQESLRRACREVTGAIYEGLDAGREIRATEEQRLGDTVLIWDGAKLAGLAVCHCGGGTEAGNGACYGKFGAVRPGPEAAVNFQRLLEGCLALAAARGLSRFTAGVNLARHEAYRAMLERGFRTDHQGVAMHRPNDPGYSRPGVYLLDDWR